MAKIKVIQTNLSAGELSPQSRGRVDIARYNNGAGRMRNVISTTLGGGKKRPGTEYLAQLKDMTKKARLIPFIVSQTEGYMLEVGEGYVRVFTPDGAQVLSGGTPYEITNPYTEAQAQEVDYSQSELGMYLWHGSVFPQLVKSAASNAWDCSDVPFSTLPFAEIGDEPAAALTLSAATVGTGRTATAGAAVFLASDVGRAILYKTGLAVITGYTSTTVVTVEITRAFESVNVPSGEWTLDSSPQTTLTLSAPAAAPAMDPPGSPVTCTLSAAGWRTTDVGKYVRVNSGLVRLDGYTSTTVMTGTIILEVTSVVGAPALAWTLNASVWNASRGYPRTGTMHEQRLNAAGTTANPQTVWGSRLGEELDFTIGDADDDGYEFTIAGNDSQVNLINYLSSGRALLALSYGGEYALFGGQDKAITPTNIQIKLQTPHGTQQVRPVDVARQTVIIQRGGVTLRALEYSYQDDGYIASDLTTLAEHVTKTGVKAMAFQQEPEPLLWIVLNNGKLISCTLDKELDIIAFNPHETDGAVEEVAVLPNDDAEQVWLIVRRSVDGAIVRYVERLQPDWYPIYGTASPDPDVFPPGDEPMNWGFQLDCALSMDSATPQTTWTGFDHLEGRTGYVIADGSVLDPVTVFGGAITLQRAANRVLFGLRFLPEIDLLTPEVVTRDGTSQGSAMSVNELTLRVLETIGLTVNGKETLGRHNSAQALTDSPPVPYTGDASVSKLGWAKGKAEATISQAQPYPFHLLAVIRTLTINEG